MCGANPLLPVSCACPGRYLTNLRDAAQAIGFALCIDIATVNMQGPAGSALTSTKRLLAGPPWGPPSASPLPPSPSPPAPPSPNLSPSPGESPRDNGTTAEAPAPPPEASSSTAPVGAIAGGVVAGIGGCPVARARAAQLLPAPPAARLLSLTPAVLPASPQSQRSWAQRSQRSSTAGGADSEASPSHPPSPSRALGQPCQAEGKRTRSWLTAARLRMQKAASSTHSLRR